MKSYSRPGSDSNRECHLLRWHKVFYTVCFSPLRLEEPGTFCNRTSFQINLYIYSFIYFFIFLNKLNPSGKCLPDFFWYKVVGVTSGPAVVQVVCNEKHNLSSYRENECVRGIITSLVKFLHCLHFLFFYKDGHEGGPFDFSSSFPTHTVFVILITQINLI